MRCLMRGMLGPRRWGARAGAGGKPDAGQSMGEWSVEEALLTHFKQFSLIFDSLNVLVYVADMETHELLFMNSYGMATFGADFAGKPCYAVLQVGQTAQCPFCTNDRLVRDGVPQPPHSWEFQNTVSGRWFLCIDQAIRWPDGRLVRMEVAVDITDRKEAEAEREQLLAAVQRHAAELDATITSMVDGVVICAADGEILHMNAAAERLLSYSDEQRALPSRDRLALLELQTPSGKPLLLDEAPVLRALERGEMSEGIVAGRRGPYGRMIWMSMSAAPIKDADGNLIGAVGTLTDMTAFHDLQEQREEYLRMISHDLRNPLTPIIGLGRWLQRRLNDLGLEKEAESAELINESAWRLQGMIEDLVESARLESGSLELRLEPANPCEVVKAIVDRMGTAEDRERIRVTCHHGLLSISVDRSQVERVLVNLLNNALKYSLPGSPVLLLLDEDDHGVRFRVENDGPGIPEDDLPRIFERYYRTEKSKKTDGLGLGLYIARLIIEAHGGRIWAESTPGQTTAFSFTLPAAR
jgi:two-component system, NtrC family, sensor histidine kinase KinB